MRRTGTAEEYSRRVLATAAFCSLTAGRILYQCVEVMALVVFDEFARFEENFLCFCTRFTTRRRQKLPFCAW